MPKPLTNVFRFFSRGTPCPARNNQPWFRLWQGVGSQNHTSSDGRFVLGLNDGTTWILYSSDTALELYHVPADADRPSV